MINLKGTLLLLFCQLHFIRGDNNLPGLDVIESGFSAGDLNSRAKIFDLENDEKSSVYLPTTGQKYTYPSFLSVISHGENSKRVEEACSGVFFKFEQVCNYVAFSIDVSVNFVIASIGVHFGLKKIHQAIDKTNKAIGISESWWGIYEVHMPPGFLLASKFSKPFQQSLEMINKIGVPKTEDEQHIYNEICCGKNGFGTHYISSIIAGGRVRVFSLINSSYHRSHDRSEIESQIEISFTNLKLNLTGKVKFNRTTDKTTKEFGKNTQSYVSYQPDVTTLRSKTKAPWNAWEEAVLKNPIAVNKSLSPITDLLTGNPLTKKHMERTIKFYLGKGRGKILPKLSDLQAVNSIGAENSASEINFIPGLDVVGSGFDATTLTTKNHLFKKHDPKLPTTKWSNKYYPNISYTIPFGYFATNKPESESLNGTVFIKSMDDYVRKSHVYDRRHHSGFLGLGSSDTSKTTSKYYRMLYAHNYELALTQRQITWYSLNLLEFPLIDFNDAFKAALNFFPTVYNPNDKSHVSIATLFFQAYGTDVVLSADMGGMVWGETFYESCLSGVYSKNCIEQEITKHYWFVKKHKRYVHCDEHYQLDIKRNSKSHIERTGGFLTEHDMNKWIRSVKYNPAPVRQVLAPIYYLLSDSHPKKTSLITATHDCWKRSETKKKSIIDSLRNIRPPPASICKKIKHNREQNSANRFINMLSLSIPKTNSEKSNPCDRLCPFVGFFGMTCPCKYHKPVLLTSSLRHRKLPNGVGVTIDMTTGQLKLPAIKYINSPNSWIDPLSGVNFSIPYDVSLSIEGFPHAPNIQVFDSLEDLAKIWQDGYKDGTWLGGQFGQRKSILDLYTKFFSKDQKTSIGQYPHALYNLTLTGKWESKLNEFVLRALRSLPKKYNRNIYSRFMDTWGTHVATKTLIGGMKEQQITMKDCLTKGSSSKSMTETQLMYYLKKDFNQLPIQSSFYTERRKMTINHRIGGNPEIDDQTLWLKSLAENPVLIRIYESVDWSNVVRNGNITNAEVAQNLVRALVERMRVKDKIARQEYEEVKDRMKKQPKASNCPSYA